MVPVLLTSQGFRLFAHRSMSAFLFLTNYRLKRSLYVKLKDGMSNSVDPDETAHMSRLFWIYAVCKSLLLSLVAVKVKEPHCCSILSVTLKIY